MPSLYHDFTHRAWYEYTSWQLEDEKTLKRINALIKDIERNGNTGIGKPESLRNFNGYWSRRIDETNRLDYRLISEGKLGNEPARFLKAVTEIERTTLLALFTVRRRFIQHLEIQNEPLLRVKRPHKRQGTRTIPL